MENMKLPLDSVGDSISINFCPQIVGISLPLTSAGDFSAMGNTNLERFNLPQLKQVRNMVVSSNVQLQFQIDAPALESCSSVQITKNMHLVNLNMQALNAVNGVLVLSGNGYNNA